MGLVFIRTIIIFVTLLFILRLMGKRQIGEMQPFELVITLIIADLACIPMSDTSIPLLYGIVAIITIFLLHQLVCFLDLTFRPMKKILSGSPSIVINKNGIDYTQLKKNNLDVSDLVESMRSAGYYTLDAVDYALYEANGSFSALPKAEDTGQKQSLPVIIIDEGKFEKQNVEISKKSVEYYCEVLKKRGIKSKKEVLIMTVDGNGSVYLQPKGKKFETFDLRWEESLW